MKSAASRTRFLSRRRPVGRARDRLVRGGASALMTALLLADPGARGAGDASGDDPDPPPERSTLYETATSRARPVASAVSSVTVLDREQIESLQVSSVAELLRFAAGIEVTSGGPRGALAVAQVRGGDANFTMVLVDGVPLNDATDPLRGGAVDLNGLPVEHVERVEIVRGPLSSFFGSAALGGVIHVITRRGEREADGNGVHRALRVAAGNDSLVEAAASLAGGGADRDWFVGATLAREQERVAEDSFEQLDLVGNAGFEPRPHATFRVAARFARRRTDDYADASGGPVFGTKETRHTDHREASVGVTAGLGSAERRHALQMATYRHEVERQTPDIVIVPASIEDATYTSWRAGWSYPLPASRTTRLSVGAELHHERGDNRSTLLFGSGPVDGSYEMDRLTVAVLLEGVAKRGPLLFEFGARVDATEGFEVEPSPRAGVSWRPRGGATRVRASVARGFKLPSFFVLASPAALGGNPDLRPEVATSADVGIERSFTAAGVSGSLTVFHARYEDLIDFSFAPFGFVNRSEVEASGAELGIGWRPAGRLDLRANATWQQVEDRETGETLRQRPRWSGGARLVWSVVEGLSWEVDGLWVSESRDETPLVPGRDSTGGYALYGTAARWQVNARWAIDARLDNLLDKNYETFIGFPGPGRRIRLGFRYR